MALADIGAKNYATANSIYQDERNFEYQKQKDEQARQDALQASRAAASGSGLGSALASIYGASGGAPQPQQVGAMTKKTNNGGFSFTDGKNAISAAKYAQLNGMDITSLLHQMASQGDAYAANAYNWLRKVQGTDIANTPQKLLALAQKNFSPLFWGL